MWRTGGCYAGELFLAHGIREFPEWESHLVSDGRVTKRVAPSYFLEVYRRFGSGEAYASGWLADRELQQRPLWDELRCWFFMVNAALFYDGCDVLNSARTQSLSKAYDLLEFTTRRSSRSLPCNCSRRRTRAVAIPSVAFVVLIHPRRPSSKARRP